MKSNEVGTTLKHPETINGNVKNLSKRMKMKEKGECTFTRRNTMHKYTRSILGNPSQQGKKTQPILYYILQEKDLPHHKPSTQKGAHKT
jgi:hypothetical protein